MGPWDLMPLPGRSVRIELNYRKLSWCPQEHCLVCGENPAASVHRTVCVECYMRRTLRFSCLLGEVISRESGLVPL